MNYQETISYLYSRLPMFTRSGASAIKKGLGNTLDLCKQLGDPQHEFKSVHVGGTNGKGSTSHMLAAILQTAGYKTGLYTSPHLRDFRERIRINGKMITEEKVMCFVERNRNTIENIGPSFFEVTVAMAFDHFAKEQVDIAVIEVGLGGRLDSTNVITPLLSVITNIGYDHVNILGDTLPAIAAEKAGIIKPGIPVVIGERQEEISAVFISKARETGSELSFASDEWIVEPAEAGTPKPQAGSQRPEDPVFLDISVRSISKASKRRPSQPSSLQLDLTGTYQLKNVKTVLSAIEQLRQQGFVITDDHVATALKQVKELTGLMGRWQTLSTAPLVICDTGHNEDGIREVLKNIRITPHRQLHIVLGMVKDKDIQKVLQMLPTSAIYYFCHPRIERAKPSDELAAEARVHGLRGKAFSSVNEALTAARSSASRSDLVFIGGSTFVVAEVV
ncbi:MAG TPA: folylpolyglutamate synthase/dihydrofolate synthase family protein [Sphingobacteriaceae bacterium]